MARLKVVPLGAAATPMVGYALPAGSTEVEM
jgi:hypothetical protein